VLHPPKSTPRTVINALHAAMQKVLAEPDTKSLYAAQSRVPQGNTSPDELDRFLRADFDRMAKLIKISGIKLG
jgi:tripartite-type tricarboxylate transporter receptor subunit TctC